MHTVNEQPVYKVFSSNLYYCGFSFVSQPLNYFAIFVTFHVSMVIYFIATVKKSSTELIIATAVLYAITSLIHIALALIDPGVIPMILNDFESVGDERIPFNREMGNTKWREYNFDVKSHFLRVRYCEICHIYKPPRSAHCRICNVCIQKIDHHCPWIGVCIGKRNYRLFLAYLIFLQSLMVFVIVQCIKFQVMISEPDDPVEYIFNSILTLFTIVATLFTSTLLVFHTRIAGENKTTNQYCLGKWDTISGNPYRKYRCIKNVASVCCRIKQPLNDPQKNLHSRNQMVDNRNQTQACLDKNISNPYVQNPMAKYVDTESSLEPFAEIQIKTFDECRIQKTK